MSTLFSGHYLRNRSTLDIGVLGYIGIVQHKEHSPEVLHIPPGTPCIEPVRMRDHHVYWWYYSGGSQVFRPSPTLCSALMRAPGYQDAISRAPESSHILSYSFVSIF